MEDWQEDVFRFHPAETQEIRDKHQHIRKTIRDAAAEIIAILPENNRERSQFFSAMDDAMKYANACVARHSPAVVQPSLVKASSKSVQRRTAETK
jgi:hypothetical protein